jgi:hypothetical protein
MLKCHVGLWLQTNTGAEDISKSSALLGQGIDDWSARWRKRSLCHCKPYLQTAMILVSTNLEHVAKNTKHAVESFVLGGISSLPLDTCHHFGNDHEIDN